MLPAERREVSEQFGVDGLILERLDCPFYIDGVPECDCGRDEGKAACTVALLLEAAVSDFAKAAEEDSPCKGVASLTFVQTGVNATAEIDAQQPGEDEQGSLYSAQFAQGHGEAVLARIAAQLAKHERSRHGALLDFIPVCADCLDVERIKLCQLINAALQEEIPGRISS